LYAFSEMTGLDSKKQELARQMTESIIPLKCFGTVIDDQGRINACGLAVSEKGYVSLFDIVTRKECRRRGIGRILTNSLLNWGKQHQATKAFLQVTIENEPAFNLYRSLGFVEAYQYWYRVKKKTL